MFPPNFLHNRLSAHYIEINHIFAVEMFKKYHLARREIIAERDACTQEERATKYALNPNYVWEPLGPDDDKIQRMKDDNLFWKRKVAHERNKASRDRLLLHRHCFLFSI